VRTVQGFRLLDVGLASAGLYAANVGTIIAFAFATVRPAALQGRPRSVGVLLGDNYTTPGARDLIQLDALPEPSQSA
jgi:hypothetical protein